MIETLRQVVVRDLGVSYECCQAKWEVGDARLRRSWHQSAVCTAHVLGTSTATAL